MITRILKLFLAGVIMATLAFGADEELKETEEFIEANVCDVEYSSCMTACDEKDDETQREACYDSCDKKYDACMQENMKKTNNEN